MRENQNLLIAVGRRLNPRPGKFFANSRLFFNFFLLPFLELLFVEFSLVCANQSFVSVYIVSCCELHYLAIFKLFQRNISAFLAKFFFHV